MSLIHDTVSERAKHQENTHLTQVIAGWKPYILHHSIVGTAHSHDYNMIWLYIYIYTFCIIYIDIRLVVITDPGRLQVWGSSKLLLSSFFHRIQSTTPVPVAVAPSPPRWVPAPNEPFAPRIWESKGTTPNATPPKKEGIMVVHGG